MSSQRDQLRISQNANTRIPLFYPRGCAAPLRGITPIATLERFVVYCSSELIISGRASGRGPEGTVTGNCQCSSCYAELESRSSRLNHARNFLEGEHQCQTDIVQAAGLFAASLTSFDETSLSRAARASRAAADPVAAATCQVASE